MVAGARSLLGVYRRRLAGRNGEIEHTFSQDLPVFDEGSEMDEMDDMDWNNEDVERQDVAYTSTRAPSKQSATTKSDVEWDDEWGKWNDDDDDKGADNDVHLSFGSDMAEAGSRCSSTRSRHKSVCDAPSNPESARSSPSRGFRSRRYAA